MEAVPSPLLPEEDHQQQEQQEEKEEEEEEKDEDMEGDEDSLSVDDHLSGKFTWTVEHFSELNVRKIYSETFVIGGHQWRILLFPKGNNVDFLSIYLDVADASSLPCDWARHAHFSLAVINQIDRKTSIRKETQHKFNEKENDWGFTSFIRLQEVCDTTKGYLVDDKLVVEVDVIVHRTSDYVAYKSKKETGYVGLKNQGATCYMNSLLQTLFHIPYFRKAVYHMPTTEADMLFNNIPLALQRLFYKIQYSDTTVSTKDLTRSFGWDSYESFMQHDAHEFNRVLCEKLEDKMKGTAVEGTIQQLFEGHHMNYIECINVDYKSTRKDSFYDLQLDVKGCKDVYESFDKYVEVEKLEGDNNYHAEHYGLQDAKKGVLFIDFPPVLQLQLKRFEYDFAKNTMVKINDRYEFPLQLDLDRDNHRYLSPDADRSMRNFYSLHSVLVHSGGVNGGHYYAFIRPTLSDQWYKFDDERVTKEKMKTAVGEQYGGEEELPQRNPVLNRKTFKFTKYSNAYMLVYIRDNDKDKIICNIDEKDIAHHLQVRLKNEQEIKEIKRKEKDESQLYTVIKLVQDQDLRSQIGKDIYFDLVDHDKVWAFRIQKQELFNNFKQVVFGEFGIPISFQRYWWWAKRQNQTYRLKKTLVISEESKTVGQLQELSDMKQSSELRLFLETNWSINKELALPPDEICQDGILLFFKLYNPEKQELRYIGRKFVQGLAKPAEIIEELNKMAGFSPNEEIQLYEEIKFEPEIICDKIDQRVTFKGSQLADGDIICIQKALQSEGQKPYLYPDFPSYLEYIQNRQVVHFRRLEKPKEDEFCLELSKKNTYNEVTERVARELCLDEPLKIRLTAHNCYAQQTKSKPMEYRTKERLSDMLTHYNKTSDILYFETLDIPLPELQGLKTLKVAYHNSTTEEVSVLNIRLPKQSTIRDVIEDIKIKVELSDPMEELRILEVFYHKIYKVFSLNDKIENINDQYWTLRAEKIPEEEREVGDLDRVIQVCHFICDQAQNNTIHIENFGDPFFLVIHVNETLAEVKLRVQKKLEVADEEFSKWKIAFVSFGSRGYLKDSDVLIDYFQKRDIATWQHYLGLEHTDSSAKRLQHSNQNWHALQKPVIIYN